MFIIGLTGGIGSGKTAVSDRFLKLGITVVDADVCSRVVVQAGSPALALIIKHFGSHLLTPSGELDRATLRTIIFADANEKKWLESLLHPLIAEETLKQLNDAKSAYVILVSPLLFEAQQHLICDRVLLIDAPIETQIARTTLRDNNDSEQVQRIINSQADRNTRLKLANDIIENTQGLEHLDEEVNKLHQRYLVLAEEKRATR